MKKKVIFVTKALWIGGIETALINLLNHFDYKKYDVTLLVLRAELNLKDQVNPNCRLLIADREEVYSFEKPYKYSRLYHLTENSENPSPLHKAMMWSVPAIRWVENRLYNRYVRSLMHREHFDTCIIYSDVAAETAIRAIDADQYLMYYHHGAMRHVYHDFIAYKRCSKIIAVSENQANALKEFVPDAADKIVTIHNLTDVDGICKKAQEPIDDVFESDKFNIVSVGRVSHEKGMDIAVRACAKLLEDGFTNVRWWIVGDGPAMQEVKEAISETHMEDCVITVGMKSNPYPYIAKADLYVQPSRFEGYPMTILEALVLGQPILSTDNNGAREILYDKNYGWLAQQDVSMIAQYIENPLANSELLKSFREYVCQINFDASNQEYVNQLEQLIDNR